MSQVRDGLLSATRSKKTEIDCDRSVFVSPLITRYIFSRAVIWGKISHHGVSNKKSVVCSTFDVLKFL